MATPNIAATLGGWSARHRLAAIGSWLALVVVTMLIGSAVGQVAARPATPNAAAVNSAVAAVLAGVKATGQVTGIRPPATSANGHQVLVQFAVKGDPDTADKRVQPVEDAVARAQSAHPGVTIEQFGQASANKWFSDTIMRDFKRAEWTVVPLAIGILLVVFGALPAPGTGGADAGRQPGGGAAHRSGHLGT